MSDLLNASTLVCMGAVLVGACVQGVAGIGFALFAAPLVVLIQPDLVPGPMLVLGGAIAVLAAVREFERIDYRAAGIALAGRVPGSMAAGLVVGLLPRQAFSLTFGLLILAAVALSLVARRVDARPAYLGTAGFMSGFMGTITAVGTPPMGLVMQSEDPARLRATIGAFLVAGAGVSIGVLWLAGRFHWRDFTLSLALLPALALGFLLSGALVRRVRPRGVRMGVLAISAFSAVLLIWKSL